MLDSELFNAIGFKHQNFEQLQPYLDRVYEHGWKPVSPRGYYAYWPLGNGCEVWVALNEKHHVLSIAPHFIGQNSVKVRLNDWYDIAQSLGGVLKVWTVPDDGNFATAFPFAVSVPDWDFVHFSLNALIERAQSPIVFDLQIAAFVETMSCYDSEDAYDAAQPNYSETLAAHHFVATELDVPAEQMPGVRANFAGTVVGGGTLTNPITEAKTLHLSVQTSGMTVDIVADASVVTGRPKKGGIVSICSVLSARPIFDLQHMQEWMDEQS